MYPEMYKCHDPNVPDDGKVTAGMPHPQQQNPAGMKYPGMGGGLPQGNGGANHFAKQEQVTSRIFNQLSQLPTFQSDGSGGQAWAQGQQSLPQSTHMVSFFHIHP